jgi:hypothetical protein
MAGLRAEVLGGMFALVARINAMVWYAANVICCNKLRLTPHFIFPIRTPLPTSWARRYDIIVCYYPWAFVLLDLGRAGAKVVEDLGDVMADRFTRTGIREWISLSAADESSIVRSSARCVAISEGDRKEFLRLYGMSLPVFPFLPPQHAALMRLGEVREGSRIGFIGAPSALNRRVLVALGTPAFVDRFRTLGAELQIAGGICDSLTQERIGMLRSAGIKVVGRITDLAAFYANVDVLLNPVGPSTGMKIKSVEALLAGRILVTTRFGVDRSFSAAFPGQIVTIEWPFQAESLVDGIQRARSLIRERSASGSTAEPPGAEYIRRVSRAWADVMG